MSDWVEDARESARRYAEDFLKPAEAAQEGWRGFVHGRAKAEYNIARVPKGWVCFVSVKAGGDGRMSPWCGPYQTRAGALDYALELMRGALRDMAGNVKTQWTFPDDAAKVLAMIDDGVLFFVEPEPQRIVKALENGVLKMVDLDEIQNKEV